MPPAYAYSAAPIPCDWLALVAGLARRRGFWWLDSALVGAPLGRFSFAGAEPAQLAHLDGAADPLAALRALLPAAGARVECADAEPCALPFVGGVVTGLGYELGSRFERVPIAQDDAPVPLGSFALRVDRFFACDHLNARVWAIALCAGASAREAAQAARELAANAPSAAWPEAPAPQRARSDVSRGFDAQEHAKAVALIRERIADGALYQACLTHRLEAPFAGDAFAYYCALRAANPAPFGAFIALPEGAIACSSPERFLKLDGARWLETRPIKGTRPRRVDPAADRAEAAALRASEKDRAENLMIVDLARNDLGRVSELGSVHVPELFAVESYATVHQLVSTVRGRLRPELDATGAIRAAFPPGSMTGAPKLAAMALLARIERARRGLYAGALGYLDVRGGCDLAVVIRSAFLTAGRIALHTGGGIVADSDATAEWAEAEAKAAALLRAAGAKV
ncbi:MAG: aminodeoxychorismate synthase component I [Deltaproteobacteria bacterium]|nr:aminodeoxychorismate synthase component I [Deltaproteobacteria bacterium]